MSFFINPAQPYSSITTPILHGITSACKSIKSIKLHSCDYTTKHHLPHHHAMYTYVAATYLLLPFSLPPNLHGFLHLHPTESSPLVRLSHSQPIFLYMTIPINLPSSDAGTKSLKKILQ